MSTSEQRKHIAFVIVLLVALSASSHTTFADAGEFRATGAMTISRLAHTATLLKNSRVLIAGGVSDSGTTARKLSPG